MTPLKLTIEGLYSYRDPQTIDFRRLTEAQLFGIFGPTGSGKSAILEAMTLALYGKSERSQEIRTDRNYHMMNLSANVLSIEFEFSHSDQPGEEPRLYLFTYRTRRNGKHFEKVSSPVRGQFEMDAGGEWRPVGYGDAEPILGLSYQNFRRTIIIPQGKFEEFLQLNPSDRSRMLMEIFGLKKYDLSKKTLIVQRKNNSEIIRLETLLGKLAEVSKERLTEAGKIILQQEKEVNELGGKIEGMEKSQAEAASLKELFVMLNMARSELILMSERKEEMDTRERNLETYDTCLRVFKPMLDSRSKTQAQIEAAGKKLEARRNEAADLEKDIEGKATLFEQLKKTYEDRDKFREKAEDLNWLLELKKMKENIAALDKRITNGNVKVADKQKEIADLEAGLERQQAEQTKLLSKRPDLPVLLAASEWFAKKRESLGELQRLTGELVELSGELAALDAEVSRILELATLDPAQLDLPTDKILDILSAMIRSAKEMEAQHSAEKDRALIAHHLAEHASDLVEGEACPLCGATHHPDPLQDEQASREIELATAKFEEQGKRISSLEEIRTQLSSLSTQRESALQKKTGLEKAHEAADDGLTVLMKSFDWPKLDPEKPEALEAELERGQQIEVQVKALSTELANSQSALKTERANLEHFLAVLEPLKTQRLEQDQRFQGGLGKLRQVSLEEYLPHSTLEIQEEARESQETYEGIGETYSQQEAQLNARRSEADTLKGVIRELENQIRELNQRLGSEVQALNEKVKAHNYAGLDEVELILAWALGVEDERKAIREFREGLLAAAARVKDLEAQTRGKKFDAEAFDQLEAQIEELRADLQEKTMELGALRDEMERLKRELKEKKALQKDMSRAQLKADNLRTLSRLFNQMGFVNYISSIFLHNLCAAANERFKILTRHQLQLETTEDNHFVVRDHLNAGERRSVRTLSGGQTFQAALCLALALSDQVQQQVRSRENFFFLDEGFGSQDKESLAVIFQTLKSLRRENRVVGIISHVEELQQEVEVSLQIRNVAEKGSQISNSWTG